MAIFVQKLKFYNTIDVATFNTNDLTAIFEQTWPKCAGRGHMLLHVDNAIISF